MLQIVDPQGQTIGIAEKLAAHEQGGTLHRAVSVLLIDDEGRMLIQRRAATKYHFADKWANACCTHPLLSESPLEAGRRALRQELGIDTPLVEVTQFIYEAFDPVSGYTEQEYDHVLVGSWKEGIVPNPLEVSKVEWLSPLELQMRLNKNPDDFAFWFRQILKELLDIPSSAPVALQELASFIAAFKEVEDPSTSMC